MKREFIKEIHDKLFEFMSLYFEKFGVIFHRLNGVEPKCNKSQNKTIAILKRQGEITATELGKKLDMQKGSLTTLIDSLEHMGLVAREPDLTDRRKYLLSLTKQGEDYFESKSRFYEEHLRQLFKSISVKEAEEFLEKLSYMVKFIKKL